MTVAIKKYIIRHEKKAVSYDTFSESLIQGSKNIANKPAILKEYKNTIDKILPFRIQHKRYINVCYRIQDTNKRWCCSYT